MKVFLFILTLCAGLSNARLQGSSRRSLWGWDYHYGWYTPLPDDICEGRHVHGHCHVRMDNVEWSWCEYGGKCPIVIFLHDKGQTAYNYMRESHSWWYGLIGVYPQAYQNTWNTHNVEGNDILNSLDDVAFIAKIIQHVKTLPKLKDSNVYVVGTGNGAQLAYILAANAGPNLPIKGIGAAYMSLLQTPAQYGPGPMKNTQPTSESYPVSVYQTMHTADVKVPFDGGNSPHSYSNDAFKLMPADLSIKTWADHNRCHSNSMRPYWQGDMKEYECPDTIVILDALDYNKYYSYKVYDFIHHVDHLPPRVEKFSDCCSDTKFNVTVNDEVFRCAELKYDTSKCGWTNTFNETGDMRCPLECSPTCIEERAFQTNELKCD